MSHRQFQVMWALLVLVALAVAVGGIALATSLRETARAEHAAQLVSEQRQRDLCDIIKIFVTPDQPPAVSDRARTQLGRLQDYYRRDCAGH